MQDGNQLPSVTIVIEWENAIVVENDYTEKAMAGLQSELEATSGRFDAKPYVTYLYNDKTVDPQVIWDTIGRAAPRLAELSELEVLPTPGFTYYRLKNFGIARATTEMSIMLDSDAAPQPGWLENILRPFQDPSIMAVGGFTVLAYEDLLSKTMALSWIFDLAHEREKTIKRHKLHPNNCAVRTDFFRANPYPDLPAFKKQCGFWLRDLADRGYGYLRTADAMTLHAPHPGIGFIAWRGWQTGTDRDFQCFHTVTQSRLGRIAYSSKYFVRKVRRAWSNIIHKGSKVDLPVWQRPFAMMISLGFYLVVFSGALYAGLTRSYEPIPASHSRRLVTPSAA